jgi:hypothetical protein
MMVSLAAGGEASFCEANQPSLGRFCSISSVSDSEAQGPGAANAMCVTGTGKKTPGTGKKTPGGAGTHTGHTGHADTRDTRTHKGTRTTQTNLATIQTHQQHAPRTSARRPKPRPTQQPQARSRPCVTGTGRETIATSYPDSSNVGTCRNRPKLRGSERNVKVPCDHKGRYPSWNLKEPDMGIQSEPIGVSPVWSMGIFPPFWGTKGPVESLT